MANLGPLQYVQQKFKWWWRDAPQKRLKDAKIVVLCGPSGAGKSSMVKPLMKKYGDKFGFSVSHTTRDPRPGEKDGVDYYFVKKECMEKAIENSEFIEYARVHKNVYGTSFAGVTAVTDKGQRCILDVDVQGVDNIKASSIDGEACYIFVAPPSIEELETRLRGRGTECEEKIQTRLGNAKTEMQYMSKADFWDHVLINDDVDRAYKELEKILGVAEQQNKDAQQDKKGGS